MAQSNNVAQPLRVPLAGNIKARDGFASRRYPFNVVVDQQLVNCYAEYNPETKAFNIEKRPGYSNSFFEPAVAGAGSGLFQFTPDVVGTVVTNSDSFVSISGNKAYLIWNIQLPGPTCDFIEMGTVDTTGGPYRAIIMPFANLGGAKTIVIGNGVKAYFSPGLVAGDLTQITDPQFPTLFYKGWAYLNSRLYVGQPRNILHGAENINDPEMWETLNVILAQDESDNGVAIAKHSSFIVFFKETSTEFFFDNANPTGSPLLPSPQNSYDIGCFDQDSIRDIDGTLLWVTRSKSTVPQVARMDNAQYTIISTPEIEKILMRLAGNGINSTTMKMSGHRFYLLSCGDTITLVYDLDQQLWYVWEGDAITNLASYWPISDCITTAPSTAGEVFTIVQDERNGNLYLAGPDYTFPSDDDYVFAVDIYTPNFDGGIDRIKQVNAMYFDADYVSGSEIQVRTNDFDYAVDKWSDFTTVALDVEKPMLTKMGSFYRRAHHIRHQKDCPFIIRNVGLQVDIGSL